MLFAIFEVYFKSLYFTGPRLKRLEALVPTLATKLDMYSSESDAEEPNPRENVFGL